MVGHTRKSMEYIKSLMLLEDTRNILEESKSEGALGDNVDLDLNYRKTGNVCITLGEQSRKPIWAFAHLDNISYLTGPIENGVYPLTAFHEQLCVSLLQYHARRT